MANICVLEIELGFTDAEEAQAFKEFFEAELKKANENNQGVYIGSERYLFDAGIGAAIEERLVIYGNVKWALSQDEAVKLIAFVNECRELKEAIIYYEECGNLIYGKFIYKDFVLKDNFIAANHKIWDKDYDDDDYHDELAKALETGGVTQIIN